MYRRRFFLLSAALIAAAIYFVISLLRHSAGQLPWDFAINWTAAQAMRQGIPLYSHNELQLLAQSLIGPGMAPMFRDQFTSYIGPPSTALLMLPFTLLAFPQAVLLYRIAITLAFAASIFLVGLSMPLRSRRLAWIAGALAMLLFYPVMVSIQLGQVDAWVMLSLATSIWASSRDRWWLAGAGIGLAALLKVSPVLILLYLLLRIRRQAKVMMVVGAIVPVAALLDLSTLVAHPGDLITFLRDVLPTLSGGSLHTQNQSLPAWIARLFMPDTDLLTFTHGTGLFSPLGLLLACIVAAVLAIKRRGQAFSTLEYGPLILLALLAGPISWDHYASWAILALILMSDPLLWARLGDSRRLLPLLCLGLGAVLLMLPVPYFSEASVAANWTVRLATGPYTIALLLWLGTSLALLMVSSHKRSSPAFDTHPPYMYNLE